MVEIYHVVWSRFIVLSAMSRVGVVGVREREGAPRVLSGVKLPHLLSKGSAGRDREQTDRALGTGAVRGVEDRPGKGGVHIHSDACSESGRHPGGSGGYFRDAAGPPRCSPAASGTIALDG